jgi:SAM-dependent methyltransferase
MTQTPHSSSELVTIYQERFSGQEAYRFAVWSVLCRDFFQQWVPHDATVLDLGCGYGEFIRQIKARHKLGMDLNPTAASKLPPEVRLLAQDCSAPWELPDASLDVVFTSNFFEHLPDKSALGRTLDQVRRCLKPGGRLIAMGPNIKFLPGRYWDFWDHYLPLTELSLREGLEIRGFNISECHPRFLPYTMATGPRYPLLFLRLFLRCRVAWMLIGRQFLVSAAKH